MGENRHGILGTYSGDDEGDTPLLYSASPEPRPQTAETADAPPNTLSDSLMTIFSEHEATNDLLEATNDFARAKESKSVQIESAISVGVPHP